MDPLSLFLTVIGLAAIVYIVIGEDKLKEFYYTYLNNNYPQYNNIPCNINYNTNYYNYPQYNTPYQQYNNPYNNPYPQYNMPCNYSYITPKKFAYNNPYSMQENEVTGKNKNDNFILRSPNYCINGTHSGDENPFIDASNYINYNVSKKKISNGCNIENAYTIRASPYLKKYRKEIEYNSYSPICTPNKKDDSLSDIDLDELANPSYNNHKSNYTSSFAGLNQRLFESSYYNRNDVYSKKYN